MKKLIEDFPLHLRNAVQYVSKQKKQGRISIPEKVIVAGMGGSGIAAKIIVDILADQLPVPVLLYNSYFFPLYVNKKSRVIVSSYSGNTEETLLFFERTLEKKIPHSIITSGGKLLEKGKALKSEILQLPEGFPPRACLGYSMVYFLSLLIRYKLSEEKYLQQIVQASHFLELEQPDIQENAYKMARRLFRKMIVIYALGKNEGIAVRLRQQINENAKMLCWHHVFPEMTHNELVGWKGKYENVGVITLRTSYDYPTNIKRWEYAKNIMQQSCREVNEIPAKGNNIWEEMLYLIHFSDWLSCYLAELRNVDPVEVHVISGLKKHIGE